jgi:hypothetical protein
MEGQAERTQSLLSYDAHVYDKHIETARLKCWVHVAVTKSRTVLPVRWILGNWGPAGVQGVQKFLYCR